MNKWYDTWLMNFYSKSDNTPRDTYKKVLPVILLCCGIAL